MSSAKTYLISYNAASAALWAVLLVRVATLAATQGFAAVSSVNDYARIIQSFATLEIVHALTGLFPPFPLSHSTPLSSPLHQQLTSLLDQALTPISSLFLPERGLELFFTPTGIVPAKLDTTVMQVASRLLLVWGISWPFPELNTNPAYTSMLLAWSTTEVIRYGYFALRLLGIEPALLAWLRYSGFLVLYPMGITSEVAMVISAARGPAWTDHQWYSWCLAAILVAYIPGEPPTPYYSPYLPCTPFFFSKPVLTDTSFSKGRTRYTRTCSASARRH